jgi:ubiquinone/menaquinone biosynthesis C-methylase UbiE
MKDLFSTQADIYAKYRPGYPSSLINYILSFVQENNIAWDCATGNGQAAFLLASRFKRVFGTDMSEKQISQAKQAPNIEYSVSAAEKTSFPDNLFDLITVAQAYHWFNFQNFFEEASRVGKNNAIVAVWGYGLINVGDLALTQVIRHFYSVIIGKYWDAERKYVDEAYHSIPFPFKELPSRSFQIGVEWNRDDFEGYLNTWSSVQHYIKAKNMNPVREFAGSWQAVWRDAREKKSFSFPIFLRIGSIVK